jgi:hypothetical protein
VAEVERVGEGPKILRSFFDAAQRMARHEVVCYANCDIVLMEDFARGGREGSGGHGEGVFDGGAAVGFGNGGADRVCGRELERTVAGTGAHAGAAAERRLDRLFCVSKRILCREAAGTGDRVSVLG